MSEQQVSEVRTSNKEPKANRDQRLFTFKATYAIWLALIMLEELIALRISLKMIGANPNSGFAILIYNFSNLFLFPFTGLTSSYTSGAIVLAFLPSSPWRCTPCCFGGLNEWSG